MPFDCFGIKTGTSKRTLMVPGDCSSKCIAAALVTTGSCKDARLPLPNEEGIAIILSLY